MFVQIIEGQVRDRDGLRGQVDRWMTDLAPGATGWLGATAGVGDDNAFVAAIRFESEEAARANSERPEQGAWWEETKGFIEGDARFADCRDVDTLPGRNGSDDAGFVQFIQGRADRDQMVAAADGLAEFLGRVRPDVIGEYVAWEGGGKFTQVVYFTTEAEARQAEQAERSPEDAQRFQEIMSLVQPERFVSISDPWLYSA